MNNAQAKVTVKVSQFPNILLEKYIYTAGSIEPLPKHSHQEYQLGLSFNCQGEYFYRGSYHPIPIGSLSIIHSGEVHSPSERTYLPEPASFWMMQVDPKLLEETTLEIGQKPLSLPFFTEPVLGDRNLSSLFQNLCVAIESNATRLERDSLVLDFFSYLIAHHTRVSPKSYPKVKPAISMVCDFLKAHYQENVSLAELAQLSGLSRFYLSRLFRREMGLSLNAYQMQIRIARAKKLLAKGTPIAQVASSLGFYDQSHFGGHFKRLVGTTPGNYRKEQ
ncbi:MAG: AraC family transcriptional regulator [Xenococcaceae cyanobacterium MO_167.B27]|nr:AraC family transcriptional regulator [Xenococcaceae cyanobacterium MO_167.B27]